MNSWRLSVALWATPRDSGFVLQMFVLFSCRSFSSVIDYKSDISIYFFFPWLSESFNATSVWFQVLLLLCLRPTLTDSFSFSTHTHSHNGTALSDNVMQSSAAPRLTLELPSSISPGPRVISPLQPSLLLSLLGGCVSIPRLALLSLSASFFCILMLPVGYPNTSSLTLFLF